MLARIDLNGTWQLSWNDGQRGDSVTRSFSPHYDPGQAFAAQVPGEVHLDLIRVGLLQDTNLGLNCLAARWVEESIWFYRRTFNTPSLADGQQAWLVFECLDLAAVIYLNGEEIGRHANVFYPCRVNVTGRLKEGENILLVEIEAGLFSVSNRPGTSEGGMGRDTLLHKRNWLRKTQSSFGWDWSTRLINVGISGDVYLEVAETVRFERLVALAELAADLKQGQVTARLFVEGLNQYAQAGVLTVEIEETGQKKSVEVTIQPGLQSIEAQIALENPRLWWPIGHGQQPLYQVKAVLEVDGQQMGAGQRRVGFRHVRVNQSPHPLSGYYFILEVNGKPIFIKGGNFVPADMIFARLDRPRYAALVERALEANFNLLRIWGGGLYESDDFYDLCDDKGILLWQEFIFACAKYPSTDEAFLADVKREAAYQVRRLAHHASLVVWCGNNEMEEANYHWGYDRGVAHQDYALFHMVLPVLLKGEDGTRYYQPSSPFSPDHESPRREDMGDQHPWTVGFENTDFRDYRKMICRFPNEGGILGPTALPTLRACLPAGQDHPGSFAWQVHDNGIVARGDQDPADELVMRWVGKAVDDMTLEDFVYYGGIVQGQGLAEYIRNFRRRMFDSASAIFWMYNDNWPATRSWTIVDYYLRRTPSFHPVRRAFQPLAAGIALEDGRVKVFGINEGPEWEGELRCGLFALAGGYPLNIQRRVSLPGNASTLLAEFEVSAWARLGETTHAAFAILSQVGKEAARDCFFLPYYKDMAWPEACVKVHREGERAVFESEAFAWRVCLDLDGEKALPDNFFDIFPGIPTRLDWPQWLGEPKILRVGNL